MDRRLLILRHAEDCPPGTTTEFLDSIQCPYEVHFWGKDKVPPKLESYSGLIIMGGPQNVDEEQKYPWLKDEKELMRQYLKMNRPILGICLGAQLLAEILGAEVGRHTHREAGWHQVQMNPEVSPLIPQGIQSLPVFQWHAYRFVTPITAKKFAQNSITSDQGFVYRNNVVAVQFHPESDRAWIEDLATEPSFLKGPHAQPVEEFLSHDEYLQPMKDWYFQLLSNLFDRGL